MLTALTIISLISLLVATEAEPAGSPVELTKAQPLRPKPNPCCGGGEDGDSDRLAA